MTHKLVVILSTLGMVAGFLIGLQGTAQAYPATVNNYCAHKTYAPNGTNNPVYMDVANAGKEKGGRRFVPCGEGLGNVLAIKTIVPTRIKTDRGAEVCYNANFWVAMNRIGYARVWTVARC